MNDSESESMSGSSEESGSESESELLNHSSGSEPSEDENSGPPSKRRNISEDKDLPMFMRLQQDSSAGGPGGKAETRHTQKKLKKQRRGKS
jgi:hypothetical protein